MRYLLLVVVISGCAATTADLRRVSSSASKDDVRRELGMPFAEKIAGGNDVWLYMLRGDGSRREAWEITFIGDKVLDIQRDLALEQKAAEADSSRSEAAINGIHRAGQEATDGITLRGQQPSSSSSQTAAASDGCAQQCHAQGSGCKAGCDLGSGYIACTNRCAEIERGCKRGCQ